MRFAKHGLLLLAGSLLAGCGSMVKEEGPVPAQPSAASAPTVTEASQPGVSDALMLSFRRGTTAMERKQWAAAETEFRGLIAKAPDLPGPQVNLALVYLASGRTAEGEAALKAAAQRWPDFAPAQFQLGVWLSDRGQFKDADRAFAAALAADPDYGPAHYDRGIINELYLQNLQVALTHYEAYQGLQATPDPEVARWITDLRRRTGTAAPPAAAPASAPAPAPAPPSGGTAS